MYHLAHSFQIPPDARVREVLAREGSFGPHLPDATGPHEMIIEFSAARASLVSSRQWHPTQQLVELPDGRVRLAFRAPSVAPIVSWVLEWGPHARAIGPSSLVAQVKEELGTALQQYET